MVSRLLVCQQLDEPDCMGVKYTLDGIQLAPNLKKVMLLFYESSCDGC